ncbi:S-adenosyl-L-methionine-dependent methyltransferase [Nemania serpens]|nr:S-adenosyl-L-methionine-dependent methyltransferase [Nemania serpens]
MTKSVNIAHPQGGPKESAASEISYGLDTPELAEHYEVESEVQRWIGRHVIGALKPYKGMCLLDVGCGTGVVSCYAADEVGEDGLVVGVDVLPSRIETAQRKAWKNVSFVVADAHDLRRLYRYKFDGGFSTSTWHWLRDPAMALCQVYDIMEPNAPFALSTGSAVHPFYLAEILAEMKGDYPNAEKGFPKFHTRIEIEKLFHDARFHIRDIHALHCPITKQARKRCWNSGGRQCLEIFLVTSASIDDRPRKSI